MNTQGKGCWSEGNPFTGVRQDLPYWTSTTHRDPWDAWYVDMNGGNTGRAPKSTRAYYVWPVRGVRGDLHSQ